MVSPEAVLPSGPWHLPRSGAVLAPPWVSPAALGAHPVNSNDLEWWSGEPATLASAAGWVVSCWRPEGGSGCGERRAAPGWTLRRALLD